MRTRYWDLVDSRNDLSCGGKLVQRVEDVQHNVGGANTIQEVDLYYR